MRTTSDFGLAAVLTAAIGLAACGRTGGEVAEAQGPAAPAICLERAAVPAPDAPTAGMVWVPGGAYVMGAAPQRPEEGPPRSVRVDGFWISAAEVTNAEFERFVEATGYVTLAERPLDPDAYPDLPPEALVPASLVFLPPKAGEPARGPSDWWRVVPGADWRHPEGPGSSIAGRERQPVVHIAFEDALAYARWLGHDLPTEAEWEYAARGGLEGAKFVWGDQTGFEDGKPRANTWQGAFPVADTGADGYPARPAPVGCYPPNGYGLYDMAGNVWEWTKDWVRPGLGDTAGDNPAGPPRIAAYDPADPSAPKHVVKGGSFLCSEDFCWRYRPAARTAGPADGGASHVGFRTVFRGPGPEAG